MSTLRRAAFIAIGSELLRSDRVDTNSLVAARGLRRCGVVLTEKRVVEDSEAAIASAVVELARRCEIVITSGGLGPTADDATREAIAAAFGLSLARDRHLLDVIAARYRSRGREMPAIAAKMADVITGATVLDNPVGQAPGQVVPVGGTEIALLPGVPREFAAILDRHLLPRWAWSTEVVVRELRLAGVWESAVEQRINHLYERFGRERVTILGGRAQVSLVLTADGPDAAGRVAEMDQAFSELAGEDLFGRDDDTLAGVVLAALRERGWRLAVAESCTGGLIAAALAAVPGASDVFQGGVIAYSDQIKVALLGVPADVIAKHGAVSQPTAEAMARGALSLGADCGIAVTGIAGPGGGTPEKPVGTVHIAVATPGGLDHWRHQFPGDRAAVREISVTFALDALRRRLAGR